MSVTGRSEDVSTKATSWETLALPVPFNTGPGDVKQIPRLTAVNSTLSEVARNALRSSIELNKNSDEGKTDSVRSFERHEHEHFDLDTDVKSKEVDQHQVGAVRKDNEDKNFNQETHDNTSENTLNDSTAVSDGRQNVCSASAMYVATKPQQADNIDTIVNEFESYARKSRAHTTNGNRETIPTGDDKVDTTTASHPAGLADKERERSMENSFLERELTRHTTFLKEDSNYQDNMDGSEHNATTETEQIDVNLSTIDNGRENKSLDKNDLLHVSTKPDSRVNTAKMHRTSSTPVTKPGFVRRSTGAKSSTSSYMTAVVRPNPVGHDHMELQSVSDHSTFCTSCASHVYHPPPAQQENGITRENLVGLLSKGLSEFTEEMSVVVMEKLRGEFEGLAERVGQRVKEEAVTELKQLKDTLASTEDKVQILTEERDKLRLDMVKERENMKKEYERERLKRVKEFEEQIEHREKMEAEIDKLQKQLKDKDKIAKKAAAKVKQHEEKVAKIEEEFLAKTKDIQKQLDKAKGDLLVKTSKKRLQVSSARLREETRLISYHGPRPYKAPKHVPYDEGDP